MKYEIGDFVSKPVIGICKIEDILYLNPQDERNNKLYYLIKPIEDEKEKIYVPVSNSDSSWDCVWQKKRHGIWSKEFQRFRQPGRIMKKWESKIIKRQ